MSEPVDLLADALAISAPTDSALSTVGALAKRVTALQAREAALQQQLKEVSAEIAGILEHELPDAMDSFNLGDFRTADGFEVEVEPFLYAKIPEKHAPAAFKWLREHEHGDLIKNEVKLAFGRGEEKIAKKILEYLKKQGLNPSNKESVNPQTLSAFCREQVEEGVELPAELLGIYSGRKASIGLPKKAKAKRK